MILSGERRARRVVERRSGGWCETCDAAPATDWHHRKNRSQGGRWTAGNGLHVCRGCHHYITTHPAIARDHGWSVSATAEPSAARVWLRRHGGWCLLSDAGDVTPLDVPVWGPRSMNRED